MTSNHSDVDDLIAALKDDLPSVEDQARVHKRLAGIGLFVGASGASLGAHAARLEAEGQAIWSVTPKTTILGKILGLSGTTKAVFVTVAVGGSVLGLPRVLEPRADQADTPQAFEASARDTNEPETSMPAEPKAEPANESVKSALEPPVGKKTETVAQGQGRAKVRAPAATPKTLASELAEETRLMESAIAAHQRGDRAAAARSLELHAEKFPNGALTPERERLRSRL